MQLYRALVSENYIFVCFQANPPLIITEEEIKMSMAIIDEAIGEIIEPAFEE